MAIASACVEHLLFQSVLPSEYLQRDGLQQVYRPSITFWKTIGLCEAGHVAGSTPSSQNTPKRTASCPAPRLASAFPYYVNHCGGEWGGENTNLFTVVVGGSKLDREVPLMCGYFQLYIICFIISKGLSCLLSDQSIHV